MGMAAGQARLLSITSRMSDNELRAQIINNNKMRLASESSQVSEAYIAALNEAQLMFTNYDANNNASYQALTYNALTSFNPYNNQYALINSSGNVLLSERDADFYVNSNHDLGTFLGFYGLEQTTTYWDLLGKKGVTSEVFGLTAKDEPTDFTLSGADLKNMYFGTKGTTINLGEFNDSTNASEEACFAIEDSYLTMQSSPELNEYQRLLGNYIVAKDAWTTNIRTVIEKYKLDAAISYKTGGTIPNISTLKENMEKEYDSKYVGYLNDIMKGFEYESGSKSKHFDGLSSCTKSEFSTEVNTMIKSLSNGTITEEYKSDNYKYFYDDETKYYYIGELKTVQEPQKNPDGSLATDDNGNQLYETKIAPVLYYQISKATNDDGSQKTVVKSFSGATPGEGGNPGDWNTDVTYEGDPEDPYPSGGKPAESWTYTNSVWFEEAGKASTEYKLENLQILYKTKKDELGFDVADTTKSIIPSFKVNRAMSDEEEKNTALAILDYIENNVALYANADINAFGIAEGSSYATIAKDYNAATEELRDFLFNDSTYNTLDANLDDLAAIYNGDKSKLSDKFKKLIPSLLLDMVMDTYGEPQIAWIDTSAPNDSYNTNGDAKARWYENLFNRIEAGGFKVIQDGLASSPEWIEFAFESGIVTMEQVDSYNAWNSLIYSNCSDITSQTNDQMVAKAEAEYNAAMNKIENKDKRYDLELKNIDTEHNSLQTEYESIKTAIDKNVERTFKLYS